MMMSRILLCLMLVNAWSTAFAAGGEESQARPAELRVGVATIYAPFAFKEDGKVSGVEVDFANRLAKDLGIKVTVVETAWDDLIPALRDHRIDVIMSGMSITDERGQLISFTHPYLQVGQMALIRKTDYDRLRDPAVMKSPGMRIGVHRNTTGEFFARREFPQATIKTFDSVDDGIAALRRSEIDFFIHDAPTIWRIRGRQQSQYEDLMGRYTPLTKEFLAWAVRKDEAGEALRQRLNATLAKWEDSGWLESVLDRWIPVRKITTAPQPPS